MDTNKTFRFTSLDNVFSGILVFGLALVAGVAVMATTVPSIVA